MAEANPPTWNEVDAAYQAHKAAVQRYQHIVDELASTKDKELIDLIEPAIGTMQSTKAHFLAVFERHQAPYDILRC